MAHFSGKFALHIVNKSQLMTKYLKKLRSWHLAPLLQRQIEGENVEIVTDSSFWAPESLWMVTAAIKSEDNCFLIGKLQQT